MKAFKEVPSRKVSLLNIQFYSKEFQDFILLNLFLNVFLQKNKSTVSLTVFLKSLSKVLILNIADSLPLLRHKQKRHQLFFWAKKRAVINTANSLHSPIAFLLACEKQVSDTEK